jgi:hypothetical protein
MEKSFYQFLELIFKIFFIPVGTKTRDRRIVRDSVRPHGQCPSDLKETSVCIADVCFTFNFVNIAGKMECVRSDGIIVQGKVVDSQAKFKIIISLGYGS